MTMAQQIRALLGSDAAVEEADPPRYLADLECLEGCDDAPVVGEVHWTGPGRTTEDSVAFCADHVTDAVECAYGSGDLTSTDRPRVEVWPCVPSAR